MASTKISKIIATGFGSGYSPLVPGTVGSAAAVVAWSVATAVIQIPTWSLFFIFALAGWWATERLLAENPEDKDPGIVVADEWAGMMLPLLVVAPTDVTEVILAFFLFRLFDIIKPFPARQLESWPGASGVMLDDLMAGLYALISLLSIRWLF